jgi:hypothetical protein
MGQFSSRQSNRTTSSKTTLPKHKSPVDTRTKCTRDTSNPKHHAPSRHRESQPRHLKPTDSKPTKPHKPVQPKPPSQRRADPSPHIPTLQHRPRQTKECIICTDERPQDRFPSRPPTAQCTHPIDVCRRCLRTWIETELATKMWDEIHCPVCWADLDHKDVKEFAPHHIFQR